MQWRNTSIRYGAVAKFLHWSIVILVIAQYFIAEAAEDLEGAGEFDMISRHMSLGVLVLLLALARIGWKLGNRGNPQPVPMARQQRVAASAVHGVLYLLLLLMPVTGWMMTSAGENPVAFFGLFELPAIVGPDHDLHESLEDVHEAVFNGIVAIAALHALAAVYHHLWMKDDTLRRMLPFRK